MSLIGVTYSLAGSVEIRGVCVQLMIQNAAVSKYVLNRDGHPRLNN